MDSIIHATFFFAHMKTLTSFYMIAENAPNMTIQQCAFACATREDCAGFLFYAEYFPHCYIIVDQATPGRFLITVQVPYMYKTNDFAGGSMKLYELPTKHWSFNESRQDCLDHGMELLPYPTYARDLVTLRITKHTCFRVDLQRQDDGTYSDARGEKQLTEAELNIPWRSGEPTGGDQKCIVLCTKKLNFEQIDFQCGTFQPMPVFCVLKM